MTTAKTISTRDRGMNVSPDTLLELALIDLNRGGIYWDDPFHALETILQWL
jgi:hypothetical protein